MSKQLAIAAFGLLALCSSQGWAGSAGNGSPRPAPGPFTFCYAGNVKVVYLTQVMHLAPRTSAPSLEASFRDYVKATFGLPSIDRERCVAGNSGADLAAERERDKGMFGKTKIVEINWTG